MNVANLLIEKLLTGEGTLEDVLPLESIFVGQDKQTLDYIKRHHEKHGKLPSLDLFRHNFPEESYKINPTKHQATFDELIEIGQKAVEDAELGTVVSKMIDLHAEGKIADARKLVVEWANKPTGTEIETGWEPWNPDAWFESEPEEIRRICLVEGDFGLFYAGKTNTVIAESEAGKSWLGLRACADEMNEGNDVGFIDFEDSGEEIYTRLLNICDEEVIREHFRYFRPEAPMPHGFIEKHCTGKSLVVLDGYGEALSLHGLKQDDEGILAFNKRVSRPISLTGAAVLTLDHFPKDKSNQDNAFGSVYKKNTVSGASFFLRNKEAFGEGQTGYSVLEVAKDRIGKIRKECFVEKGRYYAAELHVISEDAALATTVKMKSVSTRNFVTSNDFKQRVSDWMLENKSASKTAIRENVKGSSDAVWNATEELIAGGFLSVNGRKVEFVKPWQPAF